MTLKSILATVAHWLGLIKDEAEQILELANKAVTAILLFAVSPAGKTLEDIIGLFIPANLKAAFMLWLPKLFISLNWATAEAGKTDQQIIDQGLAYLASLTGDIKASQANTLAANISKFVSDNQGAGLTIQQALTAAQPIHKPLVA